MNKNLTVSRGFDVEDFVENGIHHKPYLGGKILLVKIINKYSKILNNRYQN